MQRQALNEEGEFITAGSLMLEPGPDDTPPPQYSLLVALWDPFRYLLVVIFQGRKYKIGSVAMRN